MNPKAFRSQLSSLWGAALAVSLATAFLCTLLLGVGQVGRSLNRVMAAGLGDAAVVVEPSVALTDLSLIESYPGVEAVHRADSLWCSLSRGADTGAAPNSPTEIKLLAAVEVQAAAAAEELETVQRRDNTPLLPGQIAIMASTAAEIDASLGDKLHLEWDTVTGGVASIDLTFSSVLSPASPFSSNQMPALVHQSDFDQLSQNSLLLQQTKGMSRILVDTEGEKATEVAAGLQRVLGPDTTVYTAQSWAQQRLLSLTGTDDFTASLTIGFAVMGAVVAALVVAITFQVLVTSRTRDLALQRCLGATRKQLLTQVLQQALLVGAGAGTAGVVLGHLIGQVAALAAQGNERTRFSPPGVLVSPESVLIPLLLGMVITVGASLPAAVRATRISPLAALDTAPPVPSSRRTLLFAAVLCLAGTSLLLIVAAVSDSYLELGKRGFVLLSFMGISGAVPLLAGFVVAARPAMVALVGLTAPLAERLSAGRMQVSTRVALQNLVRSSRRAGTTIGAVVVGVALSAVVATGAHTAQRSLSTLLADSYPFDIEVTPSQSINDSGLTSLSRVGGVHNVAAISNLFVALHDPASNNVGQTMLTVGQTDELRTASSDPNLDLPAPYELLINDSVAAEMGLRDEQEIDVAAFSLADYYAPNEAVTSRLDLRYSAGNSSLEDLNVVVSEPWLPLAAPNFESMSAEIESAWRETRQAFTAHGGTEGTSDAVETDQAELRARLGSGPVLVEEMYRLRQSRIAELELRRFLVEQKWQNTPTFTVRLTDAFPVVNLDLSTLRAFSDFVNSSSARATQNTVRSLTGSDAPLHTRSIVLRIDTKQTSSLLPQVAATVAELTDGHVPQVTGPAITLQAYDSLIDRILTLLVGLLSIAIVIAFVGVTNALVLSVVERADELATLRALGMSNRQLRLMLVVEGTVLASIGVAIGVAGGVPLGLLGTYSVLSRTGVFVLSIPWPMIGASIVAALVAGIAAALLASSRPMRRMRRGLF
ncbi:MAG: FtsX-like permease family protein [Buchananella hordeovulneris]|nr:FtsX-like permease family protein [Buchananella hordeovulneris]